MDSPVGTRRRNLGSSIHTASSRSSEIDQDERYVTAYSPVRSCRVPPLAYVNLEMFNL